MIPLLRLDLFSMEEVLTHLDTIDLFNLSLLSKRATKIARMAIKKKKNEYCISIRIENTPFICIDSWAMKWTVECKPKTRKRALDEQPKEEEPSLKFNKIPFEWERIDFEYIKKINLYWNNFKDGFIMMVNHIFYLFSPEVHTVSFGKNHDIWLRVMELLKSKNIKTVSSTSRLDMKDVEGDEAICSVLDYLPLFNSVCIENMNPSEEFIMKDYRSYKFEDLTISNGSWVTLQRMLTMDCEDLELRENNLTNEDLSYILNFWINGGMRNLKTLRLVVKGRRSWDIEEVMENVPYHRREEFRVMLTGEEFEFEIRRFDGVVATVIDSREHRLGHQERYYYMDMTVLS